MIKNNIFVDVIYGLAAWFGAAILFGVADIYFHWFETWVSLFSVATIIGIFTFLLVRTTDL